MCVSGQRHAPASLPPGNTQHPLYRSQSRYGRVRKISPKPGLDPGTFQPVASRYTDYAIPAHCKTCNRAIYANITASFSPRCRQKFLH